VISLALIASCKYINEHTNLAGISIGHSIGAVINLAHPGDVLPASNRCLSGSNRSSPTNFCEENMRTPKGSKPLTRQYVSKKYGIPLVAINNILNVPFKRLKEIKEAKGREQATLVARTLWDTFCWLPLKIQAYHENRMLRYLEQEWEPVRGLYGSTVWRVKR